MCVSFHAVHPRSRARAVRGRDAYGRSHRAGVRVCTGHQCVRVLMCTRAQHALLARRVRATRPPPRRVRYAFALHATHSLGALLTFCCPCPLSSHQRCRHRQVHQTASANASAFVPPPSHHPPTFLLHCRPPTWSPWFATSRRGVRGTKLFSTFFLFFGLKINTFPKTTVHSWLGSPEMRKTGLLAGLLAGAGLL